jgi:hypothetical protein
VVAENDRAVTLDVSKDAVPPGTVAGVQLAASLKSPLPGVVLQVASCAAAVSAVKKGAMHSADDASKMARNRRAVPNRWLRTRTATPFQFAAARAFRHPKARGGRISLARVVRGRPDTARYISEAFLISSG